MRVDAKSIWNGTVHRIASLGFMAALALAGCTADELPRPPRSQAELIEARKTDEAAFAAFRRDIALRGIARVKANYDAYAAGRGPEPIIDLLVISGGGDWGAFGAGVLKGWGRVSGPTARPQFDAVTGVSTGALIAPFAFLGDEQSIAHIVELYRNPRKDWFQPRGILSFITGGASYGDIPGRERDIHKTLDEAMLRRIVEAGNDGRLLAVNTSNLDFGEMRAWDLVAEAKRALETGEKERVHRILLASSAIPGAFPPREIDGGLYVDGALTGNILYGGRSTGPENANAAWMRLYPGTKMPKARYWVIFNNQLRPPPQVVQPNWKSVLPRSLDTASRSATISALRNLFALSALTRYQYGNEVEVRYIAVPDDWTPPKPDMFDKDVMNALADMGERMGADPASWRTDPP
jgi:predicted acylesterase/phospholipase RssA